MPEDGSVKMDDALMESLEPYDFKDAVPFKAAYLAGYVADRYDVDQDECMKRAEKENQTKYGRFFSGDCQRILCTFYAEQYSKYPGFQDQLCHVSSMASDTTWKGQKYIFAMNGQSGKIVGDLPADEGAFWKYVGTRGILISVILYIIMMVVMFL